MAKAHDSGLKAKWTELQQQFKDGRITKSDMLAEHNKAVTFLLQDAHWKEYYTAMANYQAHGPSTLAERHTYDSSATEELQVVHYVYVASCAR